MMSYTIKGTVNLNASTVEGAKVRLINDTTDSYVGDTVSDVNGAYEFNVSSGTDDYHAMVEYESGGNKYHAVSYPWVTSGKPLSYWIEETDRVWINVPSIAAGSTSTLTIKKEAGYSPNGNYTFPIFDDFTGDNPFNTGTITSNVLRLTRGQANPYPNAYIDIDFDWLSNGFRIITRSRRTSDGRYAVRFNNSIAAGSVYSFYYDSCDWTGSSCAGGRITFNKPLRSESLISYVHSFNHSSSFETWETRFNGNNIYSCIREGSSIVSETVTDLNIEDYNDVDRFAIFTHGAGTNVWCEFDWFFVAKYNENHPTITVTDQTTHYEVTINNTGGDVLTDYQISVDASDLGTLANDESLEISRPPEPFISPFPSFRRRTT